MIIPQQLRCDLCKNPIEEGVHYGVVKMPIPQSLRREMIEYAETEIAPKVRRSPFGEMLTSADQLVPNNWNIEVCTDCAFAIIPGLRETIAAQIRDLIRRSVAAKKRQEDSLENLEAEPEHD